MRRWRVCALYLGLGVVLGAPPASSQVQLSCEEQLAEVQTTLSYVRAARQMTEETAGRVTAQLQKRLDVSLQENEKLKHTPSPKPSAEKVEQGEHK